MRPKNNKPYKCFANPIDPTDDELLVLVGGPKEPIEEGSSVKGIYKLRNRINRIFPKRNESVTVTEIKKKNKEIYIYILDEHGHSLPRKLRKQFSIDQISSYQYYTAKTLYGTAICLNAIAASFAMLRLVNDLVLL